MSDKKLTANTIVEGTTYLAGSVPPADVAELITNPKAWGEPVEPVTIRTGVTASELEKAANGDSGDGGDDGELKGAALDKALEDAGLAKSGSVAEKRARLAEHQAGNGS